MMLALLVKSGPGCHSSLCCQKNTWRLSWHQWGLPKLSSGWQWLKRFSKLCTAVTIEGLSHWLQSGEGTSTNSWTPSLFMYDTSSKLNTAFIRVFTYSEIVKCFDNLLYNIFKTLYLEEDCYWSKSYCNFQSRSIVIFMWIQCECALKKLVYFPIETLKQIQNTENQTSKPVKHQFKIHRLFKIDVYSPWVVSTGIFLVVCSPFLNFGSTILYLAFPSAVYAWSLLQFSLKYKSASHILCTKKSY
jgi:hypothetical protein